MRHLSLAAVLVVASPFALGNVQAQLAVKGTPATAVAEFDGIVPWVVLKRPDIAALQAEDKTAPFGAYRYGAVISTSVGIENAGRWDQVESSDYAGGGALVWRLEIVSPGAHSLGILFDEFEIPEGAQVFLYSADRESMLGAFDKTTRQPNGMLTVSPLPGERVVVEYVQPFAVTERPSLRVGSVVHDYRNVFSLAPAPPSSLDSVCLIDINCPQGAAFQDIKRAVVGLFRGGFTCSGSILNNTSEDSTPYMLTADHCGSMINATIVFDWENNSCGGGGASTSKSISGAVLLANDAQIDSQLYRLNQAPPESYEPYYAGWTRASSPKGPGISISHPAGMPKKLAIDNDDPMNSGTMWTVVYTVGGILGGSSGSPLFEKTGKVIGPLCCGQGLVCAGQVMNYGRLSRFWGAHGLVQWLDPLARGAVGMTGFDPFAPLAVTYNASATNANVLTGTLPAIGTIWTGTVDTSGHAGASGSILVIYPAKSTGTFLSFGELLVDLSSGLLARTNAGVSGSTSTHNLDIPNDPAIRGTVVFAQAAIVGGYVELTNGIKLRVN